MKLILTQNDKERLKFAFTAILTLTCALGIAQAHDLYLAHAERTEQARHEVQTPEPDQTSIQLQMSENELIREFEEIQKNDEKDLQEMIKMSRGFPSK